MENLVLLRCPSFILLLLIYGGAFSLSALNVHNIHGNQEFPHINCSSLSENECYSNRNAKVGAYFRKKNNTNYMYDVNHIQEISSQQSLGQMKIDEIARINDDNMHIKKWKSNIVIYPRAKPNKIFSTRMSQNNLTAPEHNKKLNLSSKVEHCLSRPGTDLSIENEQDQEPIEKEQSIITGEEDLEEDDEDGTPYLGRNSPYFPFRPVHAYEDMINNYLINALSLNKRGKLPSSLMLVRRQNEDPLIMIRN